MTKPTFLIENAKTRFFANKEEYLKFRQSWKDYFNSGNQTNATHYMIYAALRGKDINKCFTEITNNNKLLCCGFHKYQSLYIAFNSFKMRIRSYITLNNKTIKSDYEKNIIIGYEELAKPFGISMDTLVSLYQVFENYTLDSNGNFIEKTKVGAC
jgi:hypothetical protein